MQINRQEFLALALAMGLGSTATGCIIVAEEAQPAEGQAQQGTVGGEMAAGEAGPADETDCGAVDCVCVAYGPDGECVDFAAADEAGPAEECVDWNPAGECIGYAHEQAGPADETDCGAVDCVCVAYGPDGGCADWGPADEA